MNLPQPWRLPLLGLVLAWGLLAALYWDTGATMVVIWNRSETFAHAWVVPPISAWLVWRRRADLAVLVPRPALRWLWLMLPPGLLWLLGDLAAANAATQFGLMAMFVVLDAARHRGRAPHRLPAGLPVLRRALRRLHDALADRPHRRLHGAGSARHRHPGVP
jgi:hypothetical protein